jgi:hypothetical protein
LSGQALPCASIFKENFSASQNKPGELVFLGLKIAGAMQRDPDSSAKPLGMIRATINRRGHIDSIMLTSILRRSLQPRRQA